MDLGEAFSSINKGIGLLQTHSIVETMALSWSSSLESSRPPDRSSFCLASGARRKLASNKNTFHELSRHPCFSHLIHPTHLVPGWLEVVGVSEVAADWWCHTLEYFLRDFPRNGISSNGSIFVAEFSRNEEKFLFKMQEEDLRCSYCCMSF